MSEALSDILLTVKGGMRFTFPPYDLDQVEIIEWVHRYVDIPVSQQK